MERAVKHYKIAASAGHYLAMHSFLVTFNQGMVSRDAIGYVSREAIISTSTAYNSSCAKIRSETRDAAICMHMADN